MSSNRHHHHHRHRHRRTFAVSSLLIAVLIVCCLVVLGVGFYLSARHEQQRAAEIDSAQQALITQRQQEAAALEEKEQNDSFYQKLADGFDVNILVVGDSIGEGTGSQTKEKRWFVQLENDLQSTYGVDVTLTNVSMGGNTSYAGYVRTMQLDDGISYDLAILCYGQNDPFEGLSTYYEAMIRAVRAKYPDASILSILESSQREYTQNITTIQALCEHYGIPTADTIAPFQADYDSLTDDGIHPNDAGQDIYFQTVREIIDQNVSAGTGKMGDVAAVNSNVNQFDQFVWYGVDNDTTSGTGFERVDDLTYVLSNVSGSGILGIDYTYKSGENKADIYLDDQLFESPTITFDYDFSQRHILVVGTDCTVNQQIRVVFSSSEQADGFHGMCFSHS